METNYEVLKQEIVRRCLLMEKIGYFVGTWGNISARVLEGMIVTPSKVQYNTLSLSDFVTVSNDGAVLSGHRLPSSEAELHRALYNKKADIGAVIHSHSPYATAVSCLQKTIPPFVEDLVQIIGGEIKCTRYVPAGQHKKIAEEAANTIGNVNAVLLANHGVICCGRDLDEAYVACQIVEKAALIMLVAGPTGKVIGIPDEFVRSERNRFLYKYGTKGDSP
ncbi:MAG TPA: class II aldolase/adducin family protein [Thermodesulfobacteriota bacterium]|nr:class II aldolase/adducin family protein [Thermodesulfobacteriota bacterium]